MKEIEVKILEIDPAAIEQKLSQLGATQSFNGHMNALFFDYPDRRITRSGSVLRLRQEGDSTRITHKYPLASEVAKVMHETETTVGSLDAMRDILLATGLEVIKATYKHRTQYDLPEGHVVIDDYLEDLSSIPPFLEIESPTLEQLHIVVAQLGFTPADTNRWSTYDLVRHYLGADAAD